MALIDPDAIMFGVEVEFYARVCPRLSEGVCLDTRSRRIMGDISAEKLEGVSFAVKCLHANRETECEVCRGFQEDVDESRGFTIYTRFRKHELLPDERLNNSFKYFLLHTEGMRTPEPQSDWHGFEISSLIFSMAELWGQMPQLQEVLSAVKHGGVDAGFNSSCGLHVHIGRVGGIDLVFAKKVASLVLLLEKMIMNGLIPNIRRCGRIARMIGTWSMFATCQYPAQGMDAMLHSASPEMDEHTPWDEGRITPQDWNNNDPEQFRGTMRLIWRARTLWHLDEGLRQAMMMRAGLAIRLRTAEGDDLEANEEAFEDELPEQMSLEGNLSSFEFRYPQASLDLSFIQYWSEICCKIGELALLSTREYRWLVEQTLEALSGAEIETCPVWETILRGMQLEHQIPAWHERMKSYSIVNGD